MRRLSLLLFILGTGLFAAVLAKTDLAEVWRYVGLLSSAGVAAIFGLYLIAVSADALAWLLSFRSLPISVGWFARLWRLHVAGDALNVLTPGAPIGGEPFKAAQLKSRYRIGYHETAATWILFQTILITAQIVFFVVAIVLMLGIEPIPDAYKLAATVGLAAFCVAIVLFFLAQRYRVLSRSGAWLSRKWLGDRGLRVIRHIRHIEHRLIQSYRRRRGRCTAAFVLELLNWLLGAVEIYLIMWLLDVPITFAEAWVIEAGILLIRSVLFLVPVSIGAQEVTFLVLIGAITGLPAAGVAIALIRRFRELVWILLGLSLVGRASFRRVADPDSTR